MTIYINNNQFQSKLYKAFGCIIDSQIDLPELEVGFGQPQVYIKIAPTPSKLSNYNIDDSLQIEKNELLFRINGVGTYYITNGDSIVVEPAKHAKEDAIRLFLLGSAFGALLYQRGLTPIHGSSVSLGEKCYIFTGDSGAGKSTLAAAMTMRGYKLVSDDISCVYIDSDRYPMVIPGYPQQKLWEDSAKMLGYDCENLNRVVDDENKYCVNSSEKFDFNPKVLDTIYYITKSDQTDLIHIDELQGAAKLEVILNNLYRPMFINGLGLLEYQFKKCISIASNVKVINIVRPDKQICPEDIIDSIIYEKVLGGKT